MNSLSTLSLDSYDSGLGKEAPVRASPYLRHIADALVLIKKILDAEPAEDGALAWWDEIALVISDLRAQSRPSEHLEITHIVREMAAVCAQLKAYQPAQPQAQVRALFSRLQVAYQAAIHFSNQVSSRTGTAPLIYLVDTDAAYSDALAEEIRAAGNCVRVFHDLTVLPEAAGREQPAAIIIDMAQSASGVNVSEIISHCVHSLHIPTIALGSHGDIPSRLAAVRAGACRYLVKGEDPKRILRTVNGFTLDYSGDHLRLILVSDHQQLADLYADFIAMAGMQVTVLKDSEQVLQHIAACAPDLIVIQAEMAHANGLELGALIRQMGEYRHIPLVFLCNERSIQSQIATMHLGADDFLIQPIAPEFFIEALRGKAARSRAMRDSRTELQNAMRELEFMRSALYEHAIVALTDVDGRIISANRKFSDVSGYSSEEVVGQTHRIVKSGAHPPAFYAEMWGAITAGQIWHGTLTNRAKNGHLYHVNTTIVPKLDETGKPQQYLAIRTDITAIKNLERTLSQQAERLTMALDATDSGMWEWQIASAEVTLSPSWRRLMGYADSDILAWHSLVHPADIDLARQRFARHIDGQAQHYVSEHRLRNARGEWDWVREQGKIVERNLAGLATGVVGTTQIINERIAAQQQEQLLKESLLQSAAVSERMASLGRILESAHNEIYVFDTETLRFLLVNRGARENLGYSKEELQDLTAMSIKPKFDFEFFAQLTAPLLAGEQEVLHYSTLHRRKDGSEYPVESSLQCTEYEGRRAFLVVVQDITEKKRAEAEREKLQAQLLQSQKMDSIGHLTAGIAHDFNNLLGGILGYAELSSELLGRNASPEKIKKYITEILSAGNRAKELIAQMLVFSRLSPETQDAEAPVTILQPVVKEVINLLRSSIPSSVEVNYQLEANDLRARIQAVHLHQVLLNLVINARDAVGEYGCINVRLARSDLEGHCNACHQAFAGTYAELTVSDSGEGIPEHLRTKIFDPFFTTKEVGKGTGMGLSVVHGLVHAIGGHIIVQCEAGKGTAMRVLLPTVQVDALATENARPADVNLAEGVLAGLHIMVVDDEHAMASMLEELFSMHGATVSTFNLPAQALAFFERHPHKVDILVTDETMPQLSGLDLAKAVLQIRPNIPVLLCTGYSDHVNPDIAERNGIKGFMHKPLDISALIRWLAEHRQAPALVGAP